MNIIVLADDLTGANDTGVQFLKRGLPVEVFLTSKMTQDFKKEGVKILNHESRSLPPAEAYAKVARLSKDIGIDQYDYVYKKIDSTMRGNIGSEIDAILDTGEFDAAIVAPAYPENGRVVIGGYHMINGLLLEDTEIARDPKTPVTESYLPKLIGDQSKHSVGNIETRFIRNGELEDHLQLALHHHQVIIVIDTATSRDLDILAETLLTSSKKFLWVGSAALAQSLSRRLLSNIKDKPINQLKSEAVSQTETFDGPVLTIAGSVSGTTNDQVLFLEKKGFTNYVLNPIDLMSEDFEEQGAQELANNVVKRLQVGDPIVITTKHTEEDMVAFKIWLSEKKMTLQQAGALIAEKLGMLGAMISRLIELKGLVLTGGDIAYATCSHLNLEGLNILEEVEEGIPLCEVTEGEFNQLKVVTKAGAFGKKDSLYHAIQAINNAPITRKNYFER